MKELTPSQALLIDEEAMRMNSRIASRMTRLVSRTFDPILDYEEMAGIGAVALVECAIRYRIGPVPFKAYAQQRVLGAMQDQLRIRRCRGEHRPAIYRRVIAPVDADGEQIIPVQVDPDTPESLMLANNRLATALFGLSKREQYILLQGLDGVSLNAISRVLNVSPGMVSKLRIRAFRTLALQRGAARIG